jgi:predicted hydrocarbon binding protein
MPYYFAPGKNLFQVVAQVPKKAGSLGRVLDDLEKKVKLVGIVTYGLPDGTVILSAVAEAWSKLETAEKLRGLLMSAGALDAEVSEGKEGVLVDTFHSGIAAGAEYLLQLRRHAIIRMIDRIQLLLGSGAEVILFESGVALGRSDGEDLVRSLGAEEVRKTIDYLMKGLTAQGMGSIVRRTAPGDENPTIIIHDCFECSSNDSNRTACQFFRGYIAGNSSAIFGGQFTVEETKCRLRGGGDCEFRIYSKTRPGIQEGGSL